MKKLMLSLSVLTLFIGGCATNNGPEYEGGDYNQIKRYETGIVIDQRAVVISDEGTGKFLGALIGGVLGSTMGQNSGKTLTTLGGGLAGAYAGSEIAKANATELTVEMDNGENVVVVVKGNRIFHKGDRVRIVKDGNKVAQVYRAN